MARRLWVPSTANQTAVGVFLATFVVKMQWHAVRLFPDYNEEEGALSRGLLDGRVGRGFESSDEPD